MKKGYIHVYTGNGKGKTTAAFGLALRAAGAGMRVWIGQFLKSRHSGELAALSRLGDHITVRQFGSGHFISEKPGAEDFTRAQEGLREVERVLKEGKYQVVICDEACAALSLHLISLESFFAVIAQKPEQVELIITGRNAPQELIDKADLVTEMRAVKHYFNAGVKARKGIEE